MKKFCGLLILGLLATLALLGWFGYQSPPAGATTFMQSAGTLTAIRIVIGPLGAVLLTLHGAFGRKDLQEAVEILRQFAEMTGIPVALTLHGLGGFPADVLLVDTGSLYPALHRLERNDWLESQWQRSENNQRFANEFHAYGGPLGVSNPISPLPICEAFFQAGQELGIPFNADFNGACQEGLGFRLPSRRSRPGAG